jgi:hypothetical protein
MINDRELWHIALKKLNKIEVSAVSLLVRIHCEDKDTINSMNIRKYCDSLEFVYELFID